VSYNDIQLHNTKHVITANNTNTSDLSVRSQFVTLAYNLPTINPLLITLLASPGEVYNFPLFFSRALVKCTTSHYFSHQPQKIIQLPITPLRSLNKVHPNTTTWSSPSPPFVESPHTNIHLRFLTNTY